MPLNLQIGATIDRLKVSIVQSMPDNPVLAGWSSYSQCDEDGIIRECLRRISATTDMSKTFIEVGCGNGLENNTHQLILDGYSGVWIDGADRNIELIKNAIGHYVSPGLMVLNEMVTIDNARTIGLDAKNFLDTHSVDFLSLDIDGNDLHVCNMFIESTCPKLVCVEYNAKYPPPTVLAMDYCANHAWNGDDYFGASLQAWVEFFIEHKYKLVACNLSGANAFFIRTDFLSEFTLYPVENIYQPARYYLTGADKGHPPSFSWLTQILAKQPTLSIQPQKSSGKAHEVTATEVALTQIIANASYGPMMVYKGDEVIGKSLINTGSFQEEKISEVVDFLKATHNFSPNHFVDIGANIGTHAIYSIKNNICKTAIAFEPDINNFHLLKRNIGINRLSSLIEPHQLALSNDNSQLELELSNVNFGDHRIRPRQLATVSFGEETDRNTRPIASTTLDEFTAKVSANWRNAFVWMDTQGHEGFILEGGQNFLVSQNAPPFIVTEFWPYGIERAGSYQQYFKFLRSCARIYDINQQNWQKSQGIDVDQLIEKYKEMLLTTKKEHHPHTDLLLILCKNI